MEEEQEMGDKQEEQDVRKKENEKVDEDVNDGKRGGSGDGSRD